MRKLFTHRHHIFWKRMMFIPDPSVFTHVVNTYQCIVCTCTYTLAVYLCVCVFVVPLSLTISSFRGHPSITVSELLASSLTEAHTYTHTADRRNKRTSDVLIQGTHTLFMECFSGLSSGDLLQRKTSVFLFCLLTRFIYFPGMTSV